MIFTLLNTGLIDVMV